MHPSWLRDCMNPMLQMVLGIDIAAFHRFASWEQELRFSGGSVTPAASSLLSVPGGFRRWPTLP